MPNISDVIIIAIVLVAVFFIVRNFVARGGKGDCCGGAETSVKLKGPQDRDVSHYPHAYSVTVTGMNCSNCAHRVANAFNAEDGTYAEVSLSDNAALVRTKEPASPEHLRAIVRGAGYGTGQVTEA